MIFNIGTTIGITTVGTTTAIEATVKNVSIEISKDTIGASVPKDVPEIGIDISCTHCHSKEVKEFQKSVHRNNISCADCHGGDVTINGIVSIDVMRKNFTGIPTKINITDICSNCHGNVVKLYKESIHWNAVKEKDVGSCIDCHGVHEILSYKDPESMTYFEKVPLLCANCHENQTKMSAWYYGIQTDRFDTYKKSYHYKAMILSKVNKRLEPSEKRLKSSNKQLSNGKGLATCPDCHENHNTKNESDPDSAIYPKNLIKTCEKSGCHPAGQKALIYGGKVHEGQSVYLLSTKIDLKAIVTYFYIAMIIFELGFTFGLIGLGIYSKIDIKKRH